MKFTYLMTALSCLGTPVLAQTLCTFTQECLEGDPCTETTLQMTLDAKDGTDGGWRMTTDAETLDGVGFERGGLSHLVFMGESAGHFVSIYSDFNTRYSVHMDGPFSITYHGTCEAK